MPAESQGEKDDDDDDTVVDPQQPQTLDEAFQNVDGSAEPETAKTGGMDLENDLFSASCRRSFDRCVGAEVILWRSDSHLLPLLVSGTRSDRAGDWPRGELYAYGDGGPRTIGPKAAPVGETDRAIETEYDSDLRDFMKLFEFSERSKARSRSERLIATSLHRRADCRSTDYCQALHWTSRLMMKVNNLGTSESSHSVIKPKY